MEHRHGVILWGGGSKYIMGNSKIYENGYLALFLSTLDDCPIFNHQVRESCIYTTPPKLLEYGQIVLLLCLE